MKFILFFSLTLIGLNSLASKSKVQFIKPHEGEQVTATFPVAFSVEGMSVEKAGILKPGTGHHHLIIDGQAIKLGEIVPNNETHKHFGDGSSATTLTLPPGKHTLTLQFADGAHKSLGEEYSATIHIEVKK